MKIALFNILLSLSIISCNWQTKPMSIRQFYPYPKTIDIIYARLGGPDQACPEEQDARAGY